MIRPDSYWIKIPVAIIILITISWLLAFGITGSEKAISTIGAILLLLAYILGIDTTIINRILKMKPLSGIIDGLFYLILGIVYIAIIAASGAFALVQLVFVVFVTLVGFSILIYQIRKGALTALRKPEDPKTQSKGIKAMLRKHSVYTYFISLGSDIGVAALFFAFFIMIDVGTGILYFIMGYIIRAFGSFMANRVGAPKEELLVE
jgi:hypothetical protein